MKQSDNVKQKFKSIFFYLRQELSRTTAIGKKLLTAGRTNSHLKETYENLGRLIEIKIDKEEISVEDPRVRALLHTIKACKKDLKELEDQVHNIKFSPSPEDISKKVTYRKD